MIGCLGPMVGTVVVAVNPPGPSAQMAIAEAAGPCPEDTAFCRERNPPMPTRGDNGLTFKKKMGGKKKFEARRDPRTSPEHKTFRRERNPPIHTREKNGQTQKKKKKSFFNYIG